MTITVIGLDADDTLWHNETVFRASQQRFAALLSDFAPQQAIEARLDIIGRRNLDTYGYGVKGFTLSMLETALEVSQGGLTATATAEILSMGRDMMLHPIEPLPGVVEAIGVLAEQGQLVLITKGDLFHQEAKLAASGLGTLFSGVEIVSEKTATAYRRIFERYGAVPGDALMAGNSVRSDILPMLETGGFAALIPYPLVWAHESAIAPHDHPRFIELVTLAELPGWIETLNQR